MAIKTLAEILDKLKPVQQQLIVTCIVKYGKREDFHRGLLPFIAPEEANRALKMHLENLKEKALNEEVTGSLLGERFLRNLISLLETHCVSKICEGEVSTIMHLSTVTLQKLFKNRFGSEFYARLGSQGRMLFNDTSMGLVKLKMLGVNKWEVTCHPKLQEHATTYLADFFNIKQEEKHG